MKLNEGGRNRANDSKFRVRLPLEHTLGMFCFYSSPVSNSGGDSGRTDPALHRRALRG
jgi:hypothetical protein